MARYRKATWIPHKKCSKKGIIDWNFGNITRQDKVNVPYLYSRRFA